MSWRDNLQPASFRGIGFHVFSHEYSIGRRNVVHQYPFKDEPYIEDLGLDADEFTIEGYILAQYNEFTQDYDYFTERNSLISALKQSGPGALVHPYLGEKYVSLVGKARIREIFSEGGIARFTMTFVVTGEPIFPKESIDTSRAIDLAAEKLTNATLDSFHDQYTLDDAPSFSISGMLEDFDSYVVIAKNKINSIRNASGSSLESVKSTFDDARELMLEAVRYPCQVGALVFDCVDSVLEMANVVGTGYLGKIIGQCSGQILNSRLSTTGDKIDEILGSSMTLSLLGLTGVSDATGFGTAFDASISGAGSLKNITVTTASTARQAANRLAFVNMVKSMYLAGAVRSAIRSEYRSMADVESIKTSIINSIDYMLLKLGDESASDPFKSYGIYVDNRNIYSEVENLRSEFAKAIKKKFISLPYEIEKEAPPDTTTILHLAYDQYLDISRDEEIYKRNQPTLKHPGFAKDKIKMLSV